MPLYEYANAKISDGCEPSAIYSVCKASRIALGFFDAIRKVKGMITFHQLIDLDFSSSACSKNSIRAAISSTDKLPGSTRQSENNSRER
jgi:hypothetical protein